MKDFLRGVQASAALFFLVMNGVALWRAGCFWQGVIFALCAFGFVAWVLITIMEDDS